MYSRVDAENLSELLLPISQRKSGQGVFFVRVCQYGPEGKDGLWQFHEAARSKGVIIEGQIANPDERQLNYFYEQAGTAFQAEPAFIVDILQKWMPRMQPRHRQEFAQALCVQFAELLRRGKTASILKNIYTKMMCWLYYKFERLMPYLGDDNPPRLLYEAPSITNHELIVLRILAAMGADILLLETAGEQAYLKHDPQSEYSQQLSVGGSPFPPGFTLKAWRKEMAAPPPRPASPSPRSGNTVAPSLSRQVNGSGAVNQVGRPSVVPASSRPSLESRFPAPSLSPCTNAWMKQAEYTEILTPLGKRGDDFRLFYNAFIRIKGVFDKLNFVSELHQFYQKYKLTNRNIVIVDDELPMPDPEATNKIRRRSYRTVEELIVDLAGNLPASANVELQRLMQRSFVRTMMYAAQQEPNVNRLVVSAVYLLCWIQQYQSELFRGYKGREVPCFVLMGGCRNKHDALFMRYLSQIPVDVLILACDTSRLCTLNADNLLELSGEESLEVSKFPRDGAALQLRTSAATAEQEATAMLFTDTGMYRHHQFDRAVALTLRTTYDEIFILWKSELKYRSNFQTANQTVSMPVVYAKVSGVEKGNVDKYWLKIKSLLGNETRLFTSSPIFDTNQGNPYQALAGKAIRDGKLKREILKEHRQYPFGLLREALQEHILDKVQQMLDCKLIKGTFVNGTEYTVLSTILNIDKSLVRTLQSFDFAKKNPKIVSICTTEQVCSLEDAILLTFLNLVGFDIVMFVPTGYQTIERYLNDNFPVEHQIGEYVYDLSVPDFESLQIKGHSWLESLLNRGN